MYNLRPYTPLSDGNGRVGRLLITLIFFEARIVGAPLLHLNLYFKQHKRDYYRLLGEVRLKGDWEAWLEFFAKALIHASTEAVQAVQAARQQPGLQARIK